MAGVGTLLDQREQRHDIEAAEHPDAEQIHHHPPAGRLLQEGGDVHRHILGQAGVGEEQVNAEGAQADRTQRHQAQLHAVAGHFLAQVGAQPDAHGKGAQQQGIEAVGAEQIVVHVDLELGGVGGAEKPEPANAQHAHPHRFHLPCVADDMPGFPPQIPVDLHPRVGGRRLGDTTGGQIPQRRQAHHHRGHDQRVGGVHFQQHAGNRAEQNRQKGAHLHQGVAGHQFPGRQMLRDDRVLDGAEEGGLQAHAEQHRQKEIDGVEEKAHRRERHDEDFHQLDAPHQHGPVVLVGELPGQRREQEGRQDEQRQGHVVQGVHLGAGDHPGGDQQNQRLAEHVVVEGTQKLGKEKRPEAAFYQQ